MIRLFGVTDRTFATNGDKIIQPLYARVHKEDNGPFTFTMDTDLSYVDDLTEGRIVVCPTPQGDQAFRVHNVKQTRKKITVECRHVFYDAENYLIEDSYVVDQSANGALDHLNSATEPASPFTTISDVSVTGSYRCVRTSLLEAVETVVERWGGHLTMDNWQIGLRDSIGADNGVTVQYAKNLQDITVEYNWDDVVTKLMPVGTDGLTLPEEYLTSSTQYDVPYTKCVHFDQDVDQEPYIDGQGNIDQEAYTEALIEDLRAQAQLYLDNNCVPQANYTLHANLERITDIGDTVQVKDERLGLDLMTNVIAFEYDPVLDQYTTVEFGNFQPTLVGFASSVTATTREIVESNNDVIRVILGRELSEATDRIWNAMSNSNVIYDGNAIYVVDRLPKEDAHYVMVINAGGIGFSSNGINGPFNSAWEINGTMNMQNINVINLTADLIKGGTLKLGSLQNQSGVLEVYDEQNNLIGVMDKEGLKMYGLDGSYVVMNNEVGFSGYDRNDTRIYWVDKDEFHMKKSVVEEEITLCGRMRFIAITITENNQVVNDGIGLVAVVEGLT